MRKLLALSVVTAAFAANAFALGEARVTGKVLDQAGKPVADAKISVDSLEGKKFHQDFKTNKNGEFAIFLLDGTIRYKFTYSKEGVGSASKDMKLKLTPEKNEETIVLGEQPTQASVQLQSKADPATEAFNAGAELANKGDNAGAIAKFEEALKANPEFSPAFNALARLYARTGNWAKAVEYGEKALAADGEDVDLNALLAEAYEKTGDKTKAAAFKAKAPKNARGLFNDAAKFINSGDTAKAEPLLKQAIEADPKFAQAYYELGMLYASNSKNADAKTYLSKYLELEPNGKDAATAKEMLNYIKN